MAKRDARLMFIDSLILEAIKHGSKTFDEIFLYVGRNYSGIRPESFFEVVNRRQQALRRKGDIFFDRNDGSWKMKGQELVSA
jgi:hypothetical protein